MTGWIIDAIDGDKRWAFDSAPTLEEARERLDKWNARAAQDWPGMRFEMAVEPTATG